MSTWLEFDPYVLLNLSTKADQKQIQKAYYAAARRFHPDNNRHPGADLHFRDINRAYEALTSGTELDYPQQVTDETMPRFSTRLHVSKRIVPRLEEPQVVYVLLEISPEFPPGYTLERHPMNLTLALDRSASMRGARLNRVKVAARQIFEQLTAEDRISIVSYSDRADVLLPSRRVTDISDMRAVVNTISAGGGTEIYQGLQACYDQVRLHYNKNIINHIILLTDGRTYGDEDISLELADEANKKGIGISAMGIGDEWNDLFLDRLASRTGGSSAYINSPAAVVEFLKDRITSLGQSYAENMRLIIAPESDVVLESVFRLSPSAQPLEADEQPISLGQLEGRRSLRVLLQFQLPANMKVGFRPLVRLDTTGSILLQDHHARESLKLISDQSIEVADNPPHEDPPAILIDALGKLTLYRMQQRVEEAVDQGQIVEATRRLQNLSTRLLEMGQTELARKARGEATRILKTRQLSEEGRKALKFGTRLLLAPPKDSSSDA
jgi:Ca-activated chloride channel homolog